MDGKFETTDCRPSPSERRHIYHWLRWLDNPPEVHVWSVRFNDWLHTPWHYKTAPAEPCGGWRYIAPAIPPELANVQ